MENYTVELKKMPEITVVGKEHIGPYWDSAPMFAEVYLWALSNKDSIKGNVSCYFYDNPKETSPENCRSFAAIALQEGKDVKVPDGFLKKTIPAMEVIHVLYQGAYYAAEKYKAYGALRDWLDEHQDYKTIETLLIEEYLNTVADTKEEDLLTGIYMPVSKK